jgi:hypothetical protein
MIGDDSGTSPFRVRLLSAAALGNIRESFDEKDAG